MRSLSNKWREPMYVIVKKTCHFTLSTWQKHEQTHVFERQAHQSPTSGMSWEPCDRCVVLICFKRTFIRSIHQNNMFSKHHLVRALIECFSRVVFEWPRTKTRTSVRDNSMFLAYVIKVGNSWAFTWSIYWMFVWRTKVEFDKE